MDFSPRYVSAFAKARTKAFKNIIMVEQNETNVSVSLELTFIPSLLEKATFSITLLSTHIDLVLGFKRVDGCASARITTASIMKRKLEDADSLITESDLFNALLCDYNEPCSQAYDHEKVINLRGTYAFQREAFELLTRFLNDAYKRFYVIQPDNIPFENARIEWSEQPVFLHKFDFGIAEYTLSGEDIGKYANSPFIASEKAIELIRNNGFNSDVRPVISEGEIRIVSKNEQVGFQNPAMRFCEISHRWLESKI